VITGAGTAAHLAVHIGTGQHGSEFLVEQQVVDAQARVARPAIAPIVPIGVDRLVRMQYTDCIAPPLLQQPRECGTALGLEQCIVSPRCRVVDVGVGTTLKSPASTTGRPQAKSLRAWATSRSNHSSL